MELEDPRSPDLLKNVTVCKTQPADGKELLKLLLSVRNGLRTQRAVKRARAQAGSTVRADHLDHPKDLWDPGYYSEVILPPSIFISTIN